MDCCFIIYGTKYQYYTCRGHQHGVVKNIGALLLFITQKHQEAKFGLQTPLGIRFNVKHIKKLSLDSRIYWLLGLTFESQGREKAKFLNALGSKCVLMLPAYHVTRLAPIVMCKPYALS